MKIYLIGFMGSGKTTAGIRLSRLLNFRFIDLDNYLEQKEGRSIPEIFEKDGEDHFRQLERKCLEETFEIQENMVVSTGGGTPTKFDNISRMNAEGITV